MRLLFAHSRDHALLALVIEEAHKVVKEKRTFLGRTALQKIMYFLKVSRVPMSYRFDIHHHGPFCQEILRDAQWLMADDVIIDSSRDPDKYSNYAPGKAIGDLLTRYKNVVNWHRRKVCEVVHALAPLAPEDLEMLATLDYIYRELTASGKKGPWKDRVIARFMQIKGSKFRQGLVESAYDAMVKAHLVRP